jgi:hypothetical protein
VNDLVDVSGWSMFWSRLNPFTKQAASLPHIFEILMRTATLSSLHHGASIHKSADIYIRLPVQGVATLDWSAGPALMERCYQHALLEIAKWKAGGGTLG